MSNPADWIPGQTTGTEVARAFQAYADAVGIAVSKLDPKISLGGLHRTAYPKAHTLARLAAIIRGNPPPPRRTYLRQLPPGRSLRDRNVLDPADIPAPIERDPCFHCGTRGDIGCNHRRPGA